MNDSQIFEAKLQQILMDTRVQQLRQARADAEAAEAIRDRELCILESYRLSLENMKRGQDVPRVPFQS